MNKTLKSTLIIAAAIAGIGLVMVIAGLAFGGMQSLSFDSDGITLAKDRAVNTINKSFDNISSLDVDVDLRDVILKEGSELIIQSEGVGPKFSAEDDGGTLTIRENDNHIRFNLNISGFGFVSNNEEHKDLIITYPKGRLNDVNIYSDSGNITVSDLQTRSGKFDTDLGDITLTNTVCQSLETNLDSGNLSLEKVSMDTFKYNLSLGDVDGKNVTAKNVQGYADSGNTKIQGMVSGPMNVSCDLGDIDLILTGKESGYSYDLKTDLGDINLNGQKSESNIIKEYENKPTIKAEADSGSINIKFKSL